MFPLEMFQSFRNYEEDANFLVTDDVKKAWFVFINEFCRNVSYEWNEYLKNIVNLETSTFFSNLTTSDEAFAQWIITCKYEEIKAEATEINIIGIENWQVKRKKRKKGPHNSRSKMDVYFSIYNSIQKHRRNTNANVYWQRMFFEIYLHEFLKDDDKSDNDKFIDGMTQLSYAMMPGIDSELDGFEDSGVVTYSV